MACLLSDDLSMKALGGPLGERTRAAFAAGVDIALHCNGDLTEAREVAATSPELEGAPRERAEAALQIVARATAPFDVAEGRAELGGVWARVIFE